MKTYTTAEARNAQAQCDKLEAALKIAADKMNAIVGDKQYPNGLVFDEVKFSAPFRAVKAECETASYYLQCFNRACSKELHGAMRFIRLPNRYPECKKYIKD